MLKGAVRHTEYSTYLFATKGTLTSTTITQTSTTHTDSKQFEREVNAIIQEALALSGQYADKQIVVDLVCLFLCSRVRFLAAGSCSTRMRSVL